MEARIQAAIQTLEQHHGVRVLWACESGSRAWGFASSDSDWDVRLLYVHPQDWYLRVHEGRDVLELPIGELLTELRGSLRLAVDELLAAKAHGDEQTYCPRHPDLDAYLHSELARLEAQFPANPAKLPTAELDAVFRRILG